MRVLDLFSGIGGFSLGLERAGMHTVAFCECDPYCCAVLAKHWPDVPIFTDVRELSAETLGITKGNGRGAGRAGGSDPTSARQQQPERALQIDVICGGFPCQDISVAGKGAGIDGKRSGLWSEYARIISQVRPSFAIVENVSALLGRGVGKVLGDLAALGFDAEWHCIPASAVGAPHRRDRVWIVAYANGSERRSVSGACERLERQHGLPQWAEGSGGLEPSSQDVADTHGNHQQRRGGTLQMGWLRIAREIANYGDAGRTQWAAEPDVGRVAHGIPARVDRLRALGNAVVPQIAEIIGRAIMASA